MSYRTAEIKPYDEMDFETNMQAWIQQVQSSILSRGYKLHKTVTQLTTSKLLASALEQDMIPSLFLAKYALVYHSTPALAYLQSIAENGFALPGQTINFQGKCLTDDYGIKKVTMTTGAAYGKGVYCTPNLNITMGYGDFMLVCFANHEKTKKSGDIWVVPTPNDIIPLCAFVKAP